MSVLKEYVTDLLTSFKDGNRILLWDFYNEPVEQHQYLIDTLKLYGRPMICTEYMARTQNSTFEKIMPMLKKEGVGAINWGFVAGKTNTIFAWNTPVDSDEPPVWFHDILRRDGEPYSEKEISVIKSLTGEE